MKLYKPKPRNYETNYKNIKPKRGEKNMTEKDMTHAEANGRGWLETIREQVAALELDWNRLKEMKDTDAEDMTDEEKEEFAELTADAGEFENYDEARERIEEGPLSVQVRSAWYSPGAEPEPPDEFEILLSTGGPALRIIGDLNEHGEPTRARLEMQDWFTPWVEIILDHNELDDLLTWSGVFYFGEG